MERLLAKMKHHRVVLLVVVVFLTKHESVIVQAQPNNNNPNGNPNGGSFGSAHYMLPPEMLPPRQQQPDENADTTPITTTESPTPSQPEESEVQATEPDPVATNLVDGQRSCTDTPVTAGEIQEIRTAIANVIDSSDENLRAKFVRLGFHMCVGGCNGCVSELGVLSSITIFVLCYSLYCHGCGVCRLTL